MNKQEYLVGNPGADSEDADGRYGAVHRLLQ